MNEIEEMIEMLAIEESRNKQRLSPDTVDDFRFRVKYRVCAYYRSATEEDEDRKPLEAMTDHYRKITEEHPGWELTDVFADHCSSGASMKNRASFSKMVRACRNGEYDYIITDSIACFSRNLLQSIQLVRELTTLPNPVGIYFEAENILCERCPQKGTGGHYGGEL